MTHRRKHSATSLKKIEKMFLQELHDGLSQEEFESVAAKAVLALDKVGRKHLLDQLGKDTARTLHHILSTPGPRDGQKRQASMEKVRQEWKRAWKEWDERVYESGNKEGDYIVQEHRWEEPFLDPDSLASDLEPVAKRMRPLLARVAQEDIDPDFSFAAALKGTVEEIGEGLPDWFPDWKDFCDFSFGPMVTSCLMEWEWTQAQCEGRDAFSLIHELCLLHATPGMDWDWDTFMGFVKGLPDEQQRNILTGIEKTRETNPWKEALDSPSSGWFHLHQSLTRRWDPASYMETVQTNVKHDWKLALPLLGDLLRHHKYEQTLTLVQEAARVCLRHKEGKPWRPDELLWAEKAGPFWNEAPDAGVLLLLDAWEMAARGVGDEATAQAAHVQAALCREWQDLDSALRTLHQIPEEHAELRDRLYAMWRDFVVKRSLRVPVYEGVLEHTESGWVGRLLDAAFIGEDSAGFGKNLAQWVQKVGSTKVQFKRERLALVLLTHDMGAVQPGPLLRELVAVLPGDEGPKKLARSRQKWLKDLGGDAIGDPLVAVWKDHARELLLDPGKVRDGRYEDHVRRLHAVHALDKELYSKVMREWETAHERRRNLWNAIALSGLPGPGEAGTNPLTAGPRGR